MVYYLLLFLDSPSSTLSYLACLFPQTALSLSHEDSSLPTAGCPLLNPRGQRYASLRLFLLRCTLYGPPERLQVPSTGQTGWRSQETPTTTQSSAAIDRNDEHYAGIASGERRRRRVFCHAPRETGRLSDECQHRDRATDERVFWEEGHRQCVHEDLQRIDHWTTGTQRGREKHSD